MTNPACRQSAIRNVLEVETCTPLRGGDTQQQTLQSDDYPIEYDSDRQPSLTNLSHDGVTGVISKASEPPLTAETADIQ